MDIENIKIKNYFEYDNYRVWIKDLIQNRKQSGLPCSFRWLSQQAGYTSPNFFKLVIDGARDLTEDGCKHLIRVFRLSTIEAEYFRLLVQFEKSKDAIGRGLLAEKILHLRPTPDTKNLAPERFRYYHKWWFVLVREALLLKNSNESLDFFSGLEWQLSQAQIIEALDELEKMQLIKKTEEGKYFVYDKVLTSGDRIVNSSLMSYHQQVLKLAEEALLRYKNTEREFHALTLQMNVQKYEKVREAINNFKKELFTITETTEANDSLYQMNLQFFPMAKMKDGTK